MSIRAIFSILSLTLVSAFLVSCIATPIRLPQNVGQVYRNVDVQQGLLLAAQNNILFHIPEPTLREVEKSVVDHKCRHVEEPFWAEKLAMYVNEFKKRPELLSRFHILELKRGDTSLVQIQTDLDGAITLSVQYVKIESMGKVSHQTNLPCKGSTAEFLGRDLVKTDFDFPAPQHLAEALQKLAEKPDIERFKFSNTFLSYLAERGVIFKFNHELSFEKTNDGKFVLAEVLKTLGENSQEPFHKYINYWFKEISQKSVQAQLIQMFAMLSEKEPKAGVRVDSEGEQARRVLGQSDVTYIFSSYWMEENQVKIVPLNELDRCLENFTIEMNGVKFRKPAATQKESFLRPGYSCTRSISRS